MPARVLLADADGDGDDDVFFTTAAATKFGFLRNSNGTFSALQLTPSGTAVNELAIADLTREGYADVVALVSATGRAVLFAGSPSRAFSLVTTFVGPTGARGLLCGDFDGDGVREVAMLGLGSPRFACSRSRRHADARCRRLGQRRARRPRRRLARHRHGVARARPG